MSIVASTGGQPDRGAAHPGAGAAGQRRLRALPGSVRRECLDHLLIVGERQLLRVLREYVAYFNRDRPHQGLAQATPEPLPGGQDSREGAVRAVPILGGLHHTYRRAA